MSHSAVSADSTTPEPAGWTVLARLLRPQGRRGELLAELLTDFPSRFESRDQLFLAKPDSAGTVEPRPIQITHHWLPVGRNHGRIVLTLAGIDSIELAESVAGLEVVIPSTQRVELPEDEEYIDDLIGCAVFDRGQPVGLVTAVDFPTTPDGARRLESAAPLLTVTTPENREILIPYVQSFLVSLSTPEKRIEMALPLGLLDLNP